MINRVFFEKTLNQPLQFWSNKSKAEVRAMLGEDVAQMVDYDQRNPHHCYDLFMHTLYTVKFIEDSASTLLRTAAFFHDIGKPYVAQEKHGRIVFYGHAKKSAEIAIPLLNNLGYTKSQVDRICFYICHHDDFISWVLPTEQYDRDNPYMIEISADNVTSHIEKVSMNNESMLNINSYELWFNLLLLCWADVSAQADIVYMNGVTIDSREHKLRKIKRINDALNKAFSQSLL